jgi:regulator of nucleoside diphosphate kinase
MSNYNELLLSASDAELLASVVGEGRRSPRQEADAADALADLLIDARRVPHEELPADRVAMNSRVTYREEPSGERRTVVLAHPAEANAAQGRISVLSPVGRALLGRRAGALIEAGMPDGRSKKIRVLGSDRSEESDRGEGARPA